VGSCERVGGLMWEIMVSGGVEIVLQISPLFKEYGRPPFCNNQRGWTLCVVSTGRLLRQSLSLLICLHVSFPVEKKSRNK
jgi:hypothetical protein